MVQRTMYPRPVDWRAALGCILFVLLILVVISALIYYAVVSVRENNIRNTAALDLLYSARCKELGGVKSREKAEVCIVGDKLYTVMPNNYQERIPYVFR